MSNIYYVIIIICIPNLVCFYYSKVFLIPCINISKLSKTRKFETITLLNQDLLYHEREKVVKNVKLIMAYFEQYIVAQLTSNFLCSIIQAKMEIKIIRENGLDIECAFKLSE